MPKAIAVALPDRDEAGTSSKFSEPPEPLLPSQYFGLIRGCRQFTPEQRLMVAVLESAVYDFQRYHMALHRRGKRLFHEAQAWLTSGDETGLFSCVALCQSVGIDPEYLRKGLAAWLLWEAKRRQGRRGGAPRKCGGPPPQSEGRGR